MNLIRISLIISTLLISYSNQAAAQDELSSEQKESIAKEFNNYFKSTDSGALIQLSRNPWASKRAKQEQRSKRLLQSSASMDNCKQYSLKQRRQCFVSGSNASTCELFYKTRLDYCGKYF